jgi:CRP-like cAMP-binding protein
MEVTASGLVTQRFLRGMSARHLDALAETASEVMFPARHRIFADGGYADKFWLIQSGHVALDVLVPGEGPAVIGRVGIGGLVGWSWLLPPYQWAFGAVCVTEVRAFQFNAQEVRELCAADPALRDELTRRLFQVVAGRLQDTSTRLTTGSHDTSPYAAA